MSYPICCAVPGFGAAAWTTCCDPELDEPELDEPEPAALLAAALEAAADAMTADGLTFDGLAASERVPAAAFMTMSCWRSDCSRATDLLCVSVSNIGASPLAPVPFRPTT